MFNYIKVLFREVKTAQAKPPHRKETIIQGDSDMVIRMAFLN